MAALQERIARLEDENAALRDEQQRLEAERERLVAENDRLRVEGERLREANRRLLGHLADEREQLFTFLRVPGVQATNWRAEQAIRPAVVTRKRWGGNRTWAGAEAWQALASVLRTATQQARDPVELLACLLRAPTPIVADLAIPGRWSASDPPTWPLHAYTQSTLSIDTWAALKDQHASAPLCRCGRRAGCKRRGMHHDSQPHQPHAPIEPLEPAAGQLADRR